MMRQGRGFYLPYLLRPKHRPAILPEGSLPVTQRLLLNARWHQAVLCGHTPAGTLACGLSSSPGTAPNDGTSGGHTLQEDCARGQGWHWALLWEKVSLYDQPVQPDRKHTGQTCQSPGPASANCPPLLRLPAQGPVEDMASSPMALPPLSPFPPGQPE